MGWGDGMAACKLPPGTSANERHNARPMPPCLPVLVRAWSFCQNRSNILSRFDSEHVVRKTPDLIDYHDFFC